jgi:hypothetical protein
MTKEIMLNVATWHQTKADTTKEPADRERHQTIADIIFLRVWRGVYGNGRDEALIASTA